MIVALKMIVVKNEVGFDWCTAVHVKMVPNGGELTTKSSIVVARPNHIIERPACNQR